MNLNPPPKKWELWVIGFLFLLWFGNSGPRADPDTQILTDITFVVANVWAIAFALRYSWHKRKFKARPRQPLPPPQYPPPGKYVNYETQVRQQGETREDEK